MKDLLELPSSCFENPFLAHQQLLCLDMVLMPLPIFAEMVEGIEFEDVVSCHADVFLR